jgi:hypothetical protein
MVAPMIGDGQAIRLGPDDRIVIRSVCWRPTCRDRFGPYRPVAHLRGGRLMIAFCHRRVHDELSARVDRWKYSGAAT